MWQRSTYGATRERGAATPSPGPPGEHLSDCRGNPGAGDGLRQRTRNARCGTAADGCTIDKMPNIAAVLKGEIARFARKEIRAEVAVLRKASSAYRSEVAALKRRVELLERELRRRSVPASTSAPSRHPEQTSDGLRFSAKGLASQRARLGLSAEDCGLLVGASGQSVYNWEAGKTHPSDKHLPAIVGMRSLGKREAMKQLASLKESK